MRERQVLGPGSCWHAGTQLCPSQPVSGFAFWPQCFYHPEGFINCLFVRVPLPALHRMSNEERSLSPGSKAEDLTEIGFI